MNQKNNFKILIYSLLVFFLVLMFAFFYIIIFSPLEVKYIDVVFSVDDYMGLSTEKEVLNYGVLFPGIGSTKSIKIINDYEFDIVLDVLVDEELRGFLFGEDRVFIPKGGIINHPFRLEVPRDASFGNYSGKIRLEFKRKYF
jgi:hypothetical protein